MTEYIGCVGILGVVLFIVLLYINRRKLDDEMAKFYKETSLYTSADAPLNVKAFFSPNDNLYYCPANLALASGRHIEFGWWEWNIKSTTAVNGVSTTSFNYYLAVSFPPHSVTREFVEKTLAWTKSSDAEVSQAIKHFFVLNTEKPYRAETLDDGTLIICWHVYKRRDIYDAKINWLKNNIILPPEALADRLADQHALLPHLEPQNLVFETVTPKIIETIPVKIEITGTAFYKNDSYADLRNTFSSTWGNLDLELHHNSGKFDKEGYDELESDARFADPNSPNEILFTLTDETTAYTASRLFEENYAGRAMILRGGVSVEEHESLAYCNNPFRLPLNINTYGEFKRLFTKRWKNLGIELYDTSPHNGGLWMNNREFADDFEMKNLKNTDGAFLHDYIFISDWGNLLKNIQVAAMIRNDTLNIYCENNLRNLRLREFNELKNV